MTPMYHTSDMLHKLWTNMAAIGGSDLSGLFVKKMERMNGLWPLSPFSVMLLKCYSFHAAHFVKSCLFIFEYI